MGRYAKEDTAQEETVRHIVAGGKSDYAGEFDVMRGWAPVQNEKGAADYFYGNGGYASNSCTPKNAHHTIIKFAKESMNNHPRFKEAVQQGAQQVIDSVRAKPLAL